MGRPKYDVPKDLRCKAIAKSTGKQCPGERADLSTYGRQNLDFELCGKHIFMNPPPKKVTQ